MRRLKRQWGFALWAFAAAVTAAMARAEVESLTVGVHTSCPYGLTG
jgi:hypothetical protein